ncbi:MAG: rhomboid family protein, partial [Deltaproteobacteria bacterium]
PECGRHFCRECVTEHEDRVLCAACLSRPERSLSARLSRFGRLFRFVQFLFSLLVLWLFFYYLGQALSSLPTAFHEGTLWHK